MRVVVNTSPLIALERIGQLELLQRMYGIVIRPQSVLDELNAGRGTYDLSQLLEHADWIVTEPDPPEMVLRRELGAMRDSGDRVGGSDSGGSGDSG